MEKFAKIVSEIDAIAWGPVMVILLVGTGIFLTFRVGFLTWRNLGYALRSVLSKDSRKKTDEEGDVSPFSALMTALAATIGTGNIIGVATAMVAGGPGALVWMWVSAAFGLTSKFAECMLAIKYRTVNANGEMIGGPMVTMKRGFKNKKLGAILGMAFAIFTVLASFGIGNVAQGNSISSSMNTLFNIPTWVTGIIITVLIIAIVFKGIQGISKISSIIVPSMAVFYVVAGLTVIAFNYKNIPDGLYQILVMSVNPKAVGGGVIGTITVSVMNAIKSGVSRGVFSNEAGLGSAAITAAAAKTDHHVRQGYINMTGTFFDTIVVCTITGLVIASSGKLGVDGLEGVNLTMTAFSTGIGPIGKYIVGIGIVLFAFSTILGWEYHGEKAFEYIFGSHKFNYVYRLIFSGIIFFGATQSLALVWDLSDIFNALMAVPNLICLIVMSKEVAKDIKEFQPILKQEKKNRRNKLKLVLDTKIR